MLLMNTHSLSLWLSLFLSLMWESLSNTLWKITVLSWISHQWCPNTPPCRKQPQEHRQTESSCYFIYYIVTPVLWGSGNQVLLNLRLICHWRKSISSPISWSIDSHMRSCTSVTIISCTHLYCLRVSYRPAFVSLIFVARTRTIFTNRIKFSCKKEGNRGFI